MAAYIPKHFTQELLARIDIVDVIAAYVPLRKAGKDYQACCPFHEEKTPSFTVSQGKQFYHCFGCKASGTAIGFLMEYANMRFPEAIAELAGQCGLALPQDEGQGKGDTAIRVNTELHELLELIIQYYKMQLRTQGEAAVDYLKRRGISGELAAAYELGYAPPGWDLLLKKFGQSDPARQRLARAGMIIQRDDGGYYDRFRNRIMYPIRDARGRATGFGGRTMDNTADPKPGKPVPKYINSPETPVFHKGRELYGLHQARQRDKHPAQLYIVEGYMDVLALAQFGIHNAVAALGTAINVVHIDQLFRHTSRIVFCFDGDAAGREAAWRAMQAALPQLRDGRAAYFMFMPEGDDPDSYVRVQGAAGFLKPERQTPLSDFLLNSLQAKAELDSREGRARLLHELLPFIHKLPRSGLRELLIEDAAALCKLPRQSVAERLAEGPRRAHAGHRRGLAPDNKSGHKPKRPRPASSRGLLSNIVCYILNKPQLALHVKDAQALADVPVAGMGFLIELLELVRQHPDINCAGLIEHWRGTPYEERLRELISGSHIPDEDGFDLQRQFLDAMAKLQQKGLHKELAAYAGKSPSALSAADKAALRARISALKAG